MLGIFRKLLFVRNLFNRQEIDPDEIIEEKWIADFSKGKNTRFDIKSETSYDANIKENSLIPGHSLVLSLKKAGCIAWTEAPLRRYRDLVISGAIRIDAMGGYGAGGIFFRMVDDRTYYSFLISSKGYFRFDAVRNGMPFPLIGWTELPLSSGMMLNTNNAIEFSIVNYGSRIILIIQGRWAGEINDTSIIEGTVCFAAASYDSGDPTYRVIRDIKDVSYTMEAFLESLILDSHITSVMEQYEKWHENADIDSRARLNLAGTFAAMDQHHAAMAQIRKSWEIPGHEKTQAELLLAGRLAQILDYMEDAEKYIFECFELDLDSNEGKEAVVEMAKILYAGERFEELKNYCKEAVKVNQKDPVLWGFLGHVHWNNNEYKRAASAYNRAFKLDNKNGIYAKNAANAYEMISNNKDALSRYLDAGKAFLKEGNYNDLGLIIPVLLTLGSDNWEVHSLSGKWHFAIEDWVKAEEEFKLAEMLRVKKRPRPKKDGAQIFLEALLLIRKGKRREAIPLLEQAVSLEKDYALFHFRLAENLFILNDDPEDEKMLKELNAALVLSSNKDDGISTDNEHEDISGWINNFAAQVALNNGDLDDASRYLEKAMVVLGTLPAVLVNQSVLLAKKGSLDEALELLSADDEYGMLANCAGNLLVNSGRLEEADEKYRQALATAPDNVEYLCNRAACLMELGLYGEADELLAKAHNITPSPGVLEMISYVAAKKGEYARAEQACRSALEIDPRHAPSLLSLGWILLTLGRQSEADETIKSLEKLELRKDLSNSFEELKARLEELRYQIIECASCGESWKVLKDPPLVSSMRLFATPPDDLPAGSCPDCGKTYCIACAKKNLDDQDRFICSPCGTTLKLINEGIKYLIYEWAEKDGLFKKAKA